MALADLPAQDDAAQILARAQRGDHLAMRQLYDQHQGRLFALAFRLSGNRADAQDVVQDAFVRAFKALPKFRGQSSFGTWIYRIALNLCRDLANKRKPVGTLREEQQLAERSVDPSQDGIARRRLVAAMDKLSDGHREVLVLHDVMELRHREIAQIMGVQVGTSKSQLHKARMNMRRILAGSDSGREKSK